MNDTMASDSTNNFFLNENMLNDLMRMKNEIDRFDPIKRYLLDNGFSPDNGDVIILPETWNTDNIQHPNLVFDQFIDKPIMVKKPDVFKLICDNVETSIWKKNITKKT